MVYILYHISEDVFGENQTNRLVMSFVKSSKLLNSVMFTQKEQFEITMVFKYIARHKGRCDKMFPLRKKIFHICEWTCCKTFKKPKTKKK